MKAVLLIAYHFPPLRGSSGMQRTLSLCRHLPDLGYQPVVLSIAPSAYPQTAPDQLERIPPQVPVIRAFGLDSARHLAVLGRYPRFLAWPDRWVSWSAGALVSGALLLRRYRPALLWSTYPIATAHLIGMALQRISGLPWVADFRDSMTDEGYPSDPATRSIYRRIEAATVRRCARAVLTAPGALQMYASRYPDLPADRSGLVPNGYDSAGSSTRS